MVYVSRMRVFLVWFLCLGVALASWRFMALGVEASMDFVAYHAVERRWAFFAHITLAPLALILMPFQFWKGLRTRRPDVHRWIGRVYGVSILLAGIGSLLMAFGTTSSPVAAWGFGLLAVAWLGSTGYGIWLARQGRIAEHQRWMIRSAGLTFAAVTLRVYLPFLFMTLGEEAGYTLVAWLCWVPNLVVTEWFLRRSNVPSPAAA
ncbi:DUF2306 domain-containing protein [Parasedimentitalea huanghaiensis]|uniref:DUF2306 domain-containing protein n=1 Tax=Parasedimentitalea huanghaiensis TaxID=2682100 RepID=A0A6L6WE43_9RHOB|nr:DUF2306 domain-containing protein [Zongyanglinia huanghaiensis]MVO15730.1 DUF2306 domain-containing protein [Zongyanglinia huanghaiensis]